MYAVVAVVATFLLRVRVNDSIVRSPTVAYSFVSFRKRPVYDVVSFFNVHFFGNFEIPIVVEYGADVFLTLLQRANDQSFEPSSRFARRMLIDPYAFGGRGNIIII